MCAWLPQDEENVRAHEGTRVAGDLVSPGRDVQVLSATGPACAHALGQGGLPCDTGQALGARDCIACISCRPVHTSGIAGPTDATTSPWQGVP